MVRGRSLRLSFLTWKGGYRFLCQRIAVGIEWNVTGWKLIQNIWGEGSTTKIPKSKVDKYSFSQVFWSWWKSTTHILCLPILSPVPLIKALHYISVIYLLLHLPLEELIVWQWPALYRWLANLCHYLDFSKSQFHIFNNVWQFPDILDPLKWNISNIKCYLFSPNKLFLPLYPFLIMTHSCIRPTNIVLNACYMDLNWMLWIQGEQFHSNPGSQGRGR